MSSRNWFKTSRRHWDAELTREGLCKIEPNEPLNAAVQIGKPERLPTALVEVGKLSPPRSSGPVPEGGPDLVA
jgi:hypothetical protein